MSYARSPRRMTTLALGLALGALALGGCHREGGAAPCSVADARQNTIAVTGQGEIFHKPDLARAQIGVEQRADTVAEATRLANQTMSGLLAALRKAGVADKDLQTSNLNIGFERNYPQPGQPPPASAGSYRVSTTLTVTIRDLSKVGPTLDAAVAAGANDMNGISFDIDDPKPLQAEARAKAVADARARAEELAKLAGLTLGDIVSISENGGGGPRPMMGYEMKARASDASFAGAVSPGEVSVTSQVDVIYRLKK